MSRPQKCRRICAEPRFRKFAPAGTKGGGTICMSTDEYEVFRLVDYEKKTHEECAKQMDISRTTVTEIYDSARKKIADFLVNGCELEITGGNYRICDGSACCCGRCRRDFECSVISTAEAGKCEKPEGSVRVAVCWQAGQIFPHFGQSPRIELCDTAEGRVTARTLIDTSGSVRGALPEVLKGLRVDKIICGGIGAGAVKALGESGIEVLSGVSGSADEAVDSWLKGSLSYEKFEIN